MQLISSSSRRNVFIDPDEERRIPLLTANYSLKWPVMEDRVTTYTCACTWRWTKELPHT